MHKMRLAWVAKMAPYLLSVFPATASNWQIRNAKSWCRPHSIIQNPRHFVTVWRRRICSLRFLAWDFVWFSEKCWQPRIVLLVSNAFYITILVVNWWPVKSVNSICSKCRCGNNFFDRLFFQKFSMKHPRAVANWTALRVCKICGLQCQSVRVEYNNIYINIPKYLQESEQTDTKTTLNQKTNINETNPAI